MKIAKRERKAASTEAAANTFAAVAEEWLKKQKLRMAEATYAAMIMDNNINGNE